MKTASQQLAYMYCYPSYSSEKEKTKEGSFACERVCLSMSVEEIREGRVRKKKHGVRRESSPEGISHSFFLPFSVCVHLTGMCETESECRRRGICI